MIDILELAKKAGIPIGITGGNPSILDVSTFAKLVIEAHNKQLLDGNDKPIGHVKIMPHGGIEIDYDYYLHTGDDKSDSVLVYTEDQLAAAVLKEREKSRPSDSYAGVHIWVGNKHVKQIVNRTEIDWEGSKGLVMSCATQQCLDYLNE